MGMDGLIFIFVLRNKMSSDTKCDCKVKMSMILRTFNYHVLINELYPSFVISVFLSIKVSSLSRNAGPPDPKIKFIHFFIHERFPNQ